MKIFLILFLGVIKTGSCPSLFTVGSNYATVTVPDAAQNNAIWSMPPNNPTCTQDEPRLALSYSEDRAFTELGNGARVWELNLDIVRHSFELTNWTRVPKPQEYVIEKVRVPAEKP